MNRIFYLLITISSTLLANAVMAEKVDIKPGLWKTTQTMKVDGVSPQIAAMMQQQVAGQNKTECVKDTNVDFIPQDIGEKCTYTKNQISTNKLSFQIVCKDQGVTANANGEIHYQSTSVNGWYKVKTTGTNMGMGPMTMHTTFKGEYMGPCK